ncbi:DoxX-like family protein [Chitinophaga sp. YR573]|uniref:DoxX family protein n=1 Tax=Chitinophaga sp. YR573 TaxID=1881040 RepID=UPI0008BBF77D|nr:DoxX family protein [Chitinophaga sp. YR573]SEW29358.1 DoxX-like family protein [Chitinophaga sp. YR573]
METTKIIYWVSTVMVCLVMVFSSYSDLRSVAVKEAFVHLGFPGYFRIELGVMKIIGIILLLAPLPGFCKEWAYAGFAITFISAFIAHTVSGDPMSARIAPVIVLVFLLVSCFAFHQLKN